MKIIRIISSHTYRDGGTTYVVIQRGKNKDEYEIDYSLPHDGRPRKISRVFRKGNKRAYEIGSQEEKRVCDLIRELAEIEMGKEVLTSVLAGEKKAHDNNIWLSVCIFIRIAQEEGKYA